eukprot:3139164-Alexandrium_andersonii.AAC.1
MGRRPIPPGRLPVLGDHQIPPNIEEFPLFSWPAAFTRASKSRRARPAWASWKRRRQARLSWPRGTLGR